MSYNMFLDDERNLQDVTWAPPQIRQKYLTEEWVIVRTYADAVLEIMNRGFPKFVSFDHDLGEANAKTGYDLAKTMVENDIISGDRDGRQSYKFPGGFDFYVHSQNPIGKRNIETYLANYFKMRD